MDPSVVNVHAAKSSLSKLIKRAEKGERITLARDGKPVAQLVPFPRHDGSSLPPEDPLLNLDKFAVAGPGGKLSNADIDRLLYGRM
jgi:prevent-host-death family protein